MHIFVLTGAGVSVESGLGAFRDKSGTGLWARFDPMALATPEAFARDPAAVHEFYNFRRRNLLAADAQRRPCRAGAAAAGACGARRRADARHAEYRRSA